MENIMERRDDILFDNRVFLIQNKDFPLLVLGVVLTKTSQTFSTLKDRPYISICVLNFFLSIDIDQVLDNSVKQNHKFRSSFN